MRYQSRLIRHDFRELFLKRDGHAPMNLPSPTLQQRRISGVLNKRMFEEYILPQGAFLA